MAPKKPVKKGGGKVYGPYDTVRKDGRKLTVIRKPDGSTTSTLTAKYNKEKATGKKIPTSQHVAHKPGTSRSSTSASSTTVQSASKNIGDGNKARRKR